MIDPGHASTLLVRAPNWVGDGVLAFPMVRALREALPSARLVVLARPSVAPLWRLSPADRVVAHDDRPAALLDRPQAWLDQAALVRSLAPDAAVVLPGTFTSALVPWLARVPVRVGHARGLRGPLLSRALPWAPIARLHRAQAYLGLMAGLGLPVPPLEWRELAAGGASGPGEDVLVRVAGKRPPPGRPRVGLAVGSMASSRRWPPDRFGALADDLARRAGAWVCLIGGPSDRTQADRVLTAADTRPVDLVGRVGLDETPSMLTRLDAVVSNDCGAAHLAALAGTPCIVLFGAGDPATTAPLSTRTRILSHPVHCSPCEKNTCRYNLECLTRISVECVLEATVEALGRSRAAAP